MAWLIGVAVVIMAFTALLILREGIHLQGYGTNFSYTVEYRLLLLGGLIRISKSKLIKKSEQKVKDDKVNRPEIQLQSIKESLDDLGILFRATAPVVRRELVVQDIQFGISAGFSDPVINGTLFGALTTLVGLLQAAVQQTFVVKNSIFRAVPDFVSEEGIKIIFDTTLYIRPLFLFIKCWQVWRSDQKVRQVVMKYVKKKERE